MVLTGSKLALALALLVNAGLAGAAEPAPAMPVANTQIAAESAPVAVPSMQAWPQMMSYPGMQNYYWAPPPGMMWPMPQAYPAPMVMPSMPPVTWMPFVWVMVPQAPAGGVNGVTSGPVAETPVVQLPVASPVAQAQTISAPANSDPLHATPPDQNRLVEYGPAAPATLPVPAVVMPQVSAPDAGTPKPDQSEVPMRATEAVATLASQPVEQQAQVPILAEPIAIVPEVGAPTLYYGPVAATPVVDLWALMAPGPAKVEVPAVSSMVNTRKAPRLSKPRAAVPSQPVKQRMCWTQGVVAPCK